MKPEIRPLMTFLALSLTIGCDAPDSEFASGARSVNAANYPSIAGSYLGQAVGRARLSTGRTYSVICPVRVDVASQSAAQFSGRFAVEAGEDCRSESGTISGTAGTDGALRLVADAPGGGANVFEDAATRTGCELVRSSGTFDGTISGGVVAVAGGGVYRCPLWGHVQVDVAITATQS